MEELREKANSYAEENVNNVLKEAFAKVYADGYRDGYKEREEEIAIDLQDDETEYVDLGLPSGTLWAKDYEREEGNIKYVSYNVAGKLNIPTEEQWNELVANCKRVFDFEFINSNKPSLGQHLVNVSFVGRNGNYIKLPCYGIMKADRVDDADFVSFWVKENRGGEYKKVVFFTNCVGLVGPIKTTTEYEGYKLPVRLVYKQ